MITNIVLLVFLALFLFVIARALISGKIEYGGGSDHLLGDKSTSPGVYWGLLALVMALAFGFAWLIFA